MKKFLALTITSLMLTIIYFVFSPNPAQTKITHAKYPNYIHSKRTYGRYISSAQIKTALAKYRNKITPVKYSNHIYIKPTVARYKNASNIATTTKIKRTVKHKNTSNKIASAKIKQQSHIKKRRYRITNYKTSTVTINKVNMNSNSHKNTSFKNYIYIKGGIARTQYNKFKDGESSIYIIKKPGVALMYVIGIGHKFTKSIRGDISAQYGELKYKGKDEDYELKQEVKSFSIFANGYYDVPIKNSFLGYLTAGLGVGNNRTGKLHEEGTTEEWKGKNTTNFIWNIGAGIKFGLTKRFSADLGYRYISLGKVKTRNNDFDTGSSPRTQKITAHQIIGSVIYNF